MKNKNVKCLRLVSAKPAEIVDAANEILKTAVPEAYAYEGFYIGFGVGQLTYSPVHVSVSVRERALPQLNGTTGDARREVYAQRRAARLAILDHVREVLSGKVGTATDSDGDIKLTGLIKLC
jgi:hypothetical protein